MPTALAEPIWKANRGGQWLFLACPFWEALADGDRGGGKTTALLNCFLKNVGKGYGRDWRGPIFRLNYPDLKDIVDKSLDLIPRVFPDAKFNKSEHLWTFADGEQLMFRHLENLRMYRQFHGHAFCLAKGEKVKTPMGDKPIEEISIGDSVYTPSGIRKVTRTYNTGVQECLKVSLFDSDSHLVGQQLQSVNHQILTTDGWRRLQSGPMSCIFLPHHQLYQLEAFGKHRSCAGLESMAQLSLMQFLDSSIAEWLWIQFLDERQISLQSVRDCVSLIISESPLYEDRGQRALHEGLGGGGSSVVGFHGKPLMNPPYLEFLCISLLLLSRQILLNASHRLLSILYYCFCISSLQLQRKLANHKLGLLGQQQLPLPFQSLQADGVLNAFSYAQPDSLTIQDLMGDCHPCLHFYDGRLLPDAKSALFPFQQQADAQKRTRMNHKTDDLESAFLDSPSHQYKFLPHPYGRGLISTDLPLDLGYTLSEPCGKLQTFDIEVESDNCYFTTSGIINKNSFMGFEELCNWPDLEAYEAMLSCSRPPSSRKDIPLMVRSTTNSWGVGHSSVKARFVDGKQPFQPYGPPGRQRIRIPINWRENAPFVSVDPDYHVRLAESISNEAQLKAWTEGSWDIVAGGRFSGVWLESLHYIEPFNIPMGWRVDRSHDWGSSKPFATLWYAESNGEAIEDGRSWPKGTLFVIHEDYGCRGELGEPNWKPNVGVECTPQEIAERVKAHEAMMISTALIRKKPNPGPADDPIFDVSRGQSMASMMASKGVVWLKPSKGPGSRVTGWQLIENRLKAATKWPMEEPGLFVFNTCRHLRRTLPILPRDPKKPDDIQSDTDDHCADSLRLRCLAGSHGTVVRGVSL